MSSSPKKIAIQGVRACFHDVAARKYFSASSALTMVECVSFPVLCRKLADQSADYAMMAIENTIAGSILPNYALLEKHGFKIIGETYLRIEMCFLALPHQKIEDIRFVQSHPMAILQCQDFLAPLKDIKIVEASDTAESAAEIQSRKLTQYAAIASRLAAETYGLEILKENIETDRLNFTRFLVLTRAENYQPDASANKASIRFEAAHRPGSLAEVLTVFSRNSVNMTKIQSIPVLGKPYQYAFHVDLEWTDPAQYRKSLEELKNHTLNLVHFGEYKSGEKPGA
jgi:prephenate dehydratase